MMNRIGGLLRAQVRFIGEALLRFVHAAPRFPNGRPGYSLEDLRKDCNAMGVALMVTTDIHSAEALSFVRDLEADLGLVYGTGILKPELFTIPKQGSINVHKRKVPDYRGGGAVGLWEMLDGQKEIGITVHRVEAKVDVGAIIREATIPIDPYDNLVSLSLKADLVGNDLIVSALRDFQSETVHEKPQSGAGKTFRRPSPELMQQYERTLSASRTKFQPVYGRPRWKLFLKSALFALPLTGRNWIRRLRGQFPLVILFHHLVTDRPHRMGVATDFFSSQVDYLQRHYRVVSLSEAMGLMKNGGVRTPTVAITFDDGYAENYINLRAVTESLGVPVCFFVASQFISSGGEFYHDQRSNQPGFTACSWKQIRGLRDSGFEIGSHTRNHADCGSSDILFLRDEIEGSREDLTQNLGDPVPFFSFPFGLRKNMSHEAVEIAQAAYPYVFSAFGGINFPSRDKKVWKRCGFPLNLWELELQLQSVLEGSTLW
ncbi:MAG: polysaccharide deacetylase family protein [Acidobacteriales bacterium]|nr:polysaccharide deacetylase family protein [Terriglobales bacterium]